MGVESYNFCLNYGYHLDNWVAHPHQGGVVEFLLADFNQLRVILFSSLALAKPQANGKQNSFASNNHCHLMKNRCESLKLVSKKD